MDVKIIFLNRYLDDEIYMEHLEGYVLLGSEQKCANLLNPSMD